MQKSISRREFLKMSAVTSLGLMTQAFKRESSYDKEVLIGRVAYESISIFDSPRLDGNTIGYKFRDDLLNLFYPLTLLLGPAYNPHWYRIWGGYVHSALIQPVSIQYNEVLATIPKQGKLYRLSIPFSAPYTYSINEGWQAEKRYLLYYDSNHWVTDIVDGPDDEPWYQITEAWEGIQYFAKAAHLSPYANSELAPISSHVPASEKRIEVSLAEQRLIAYEGDEIVLNTKISSGVSSTTTNGLPTTTPTGTFNITSKLSAKYMGANRLTDTLGDQFLPGVPWTAFFAEGGYAIHGAYWHNNFGAPMSRGCINLRPKDAQWLYRWVTPEAGAEEWEARGYGTRVIVS